MPRYYINIGLQTSTGLLTASAARAAVLQAGATIVISNVLRSDTEPTLIALVGIGTGELGTVCHRICELLDQDCIAVVPTGSTTGALIGPRSAKWGTFNPAYFLTLTGRRLSEGREAKASDAYQGHLPDGSGVQAHSAGGLYPYFVVAHDTPEGLKFYAQAPDGEVGPHRSSYGEAAADAERAKEADKTPALSDEEAVSLGAAFAKAFSHIIAEQVAGGLLATHCAVPDPLPARKPLIEPEAYDRRGTDDIPDRPAFRPTCPAAAEELVTRGFAQFNADWWTHPDGRIARTTRSFLGTGIDIARPGYFANCAKRGEPLPGLDAVIDHIAAKNARA